jgi:hypothetical protein
MDMTRKYLLPLSELEEDFKLSYHVGCIEKPVSEE